MELNATEIGILLFLAGHLATAIWATSRMNVKVERLTEDLSGLKTRIEKLTEAVTNLGIFEERQKTILSRLERVETKAGDIAMCRQSVDRVQTLEALVNSSSENVTTALQAARDHGQELENIRQKLEDITRTFNLQLRRCQESCSVTGQPPI